MHGMKSFRNPSPVTFAVLTKAVVGARDCSAGAALSGSDGSAAPRPEPPRAGSPPDRAAATADGPAVAMAVAHLGPGAARSVWHAHALQVQRITGQRAR